MFSIMGLVLAFTYASGGSRFDARKSTFASVLTLLMFVIPDFDRPSNGIVIVSDYSIDAVIAEM